MGICDYKFFKILSLICLFSLKQNVIRQKISFNTIPVNVDNGNFVLQQLSDKKEHLEVHLVFANPIMALGLWALSKS